MNASVVRPSGTTVLSTALMTLPLLLPRSRRRYGSIPVVLGAFALGRQLFSWIRARQHGPVHELRMAAHDPDVGRRPHLRTHVE